MNNKPIIEIYNVFKKYDKKEVLKNINLKIFYAEVFVFLGPNGAGKTTTVKILSGILKPDIGSVSILSMHMSPENLEIKKMIGYLPDEPYVYNRLTGREFLSFVESIYKTKFEEKMFVYYLEQFELVEVIDQIIDSYSKGMKQKLLLMSILLRNPEIYILDEPLIGLDPKSINFLKSYIKEISKQGKTVILCTHLLDLAESIANRIAIITNGEIIACGTKQDLIQNNNLSSDSSLEKIYLHITKNKIVYDLGNNKT